jgi:NADP-dependent 3-hydroxy acid dehydrogenase YdfG
MHTIITGHTKGFGNAILEKLLGKNMQVTGIARTTVAQSENLHQLQFDLSNQQQIIACCNALKSVKANVVILNAGYNHIKPAESYSVEEILSLINANLAAHAAIIKTCLPNLIAQQGKIIAIGSFSGIEVGKWNNYYGAAKAGLHHLMNNIFEQYRKQGVQCTTIIPDISNTDFYNNQDFEPGKDAATYIEPSTIANMVIQIIENTSSSSVTQIVVRPQKFLLERKK